MGKDVIPTIDTASDEAATAPSAAASFDHTSSDRLRSATQALEAWEKVRDWREQCKMVTDAETKVSWRFASARPGYDMLAAEVSRMIGENLGGYIDRALDRIELRARQVYADALLPAAEAIAKAEGRS